MTIVPLSIYFKKGMAKVELSTARGRKTFDKRKALKKQDAKREIDRACGGVNHVERTGAVSLMKVRFRPYGANFGAGAMNAHRRELLRLIGRGPVRRGCCQVRLGVVPGARRTRRS